MLLFKNLYYVCVIFLNLSNSVLCDLCRADTLNTESPLSNYIIGISTGGGGVGSFDFYQSKFATDHLDITPPVNTSCFN